jgi:hemerythrin-like domain-containing protein
MSASEPAVDRARALGRELVRVHDWLRSELDRIGTELDSGAFDGAEELVPLRTHCVAFCDALTRHHTSEDAAAFPVLAGQLPELAPVLEQLSQDHQLVAEILGRLRRLLAEVTPETVESVRGEIDGLRAILESHFRWEERKLTDALDRLVTARDAAELFGLSAQPLR